MSRVACRKIPGWLCTQVAGHAGGCGASEAALHHPLIVWMRRHSRHFPTEAIVEYQGLVVESLFLEEPDAIAFDTDGMTAVQRATCLSVTTIEDQGRFGIYLGYPSEEMMRAAERAIQNQKKEVMTSPLFHCPCCKVPRKTSALPVSMDLAIALATASLRNWGAPMICSGCGVVFCPAVVDGKRVEAAPASEVSR